jgi:hypothetical protein
MIIEYTNNEYLLFLFRWLWIDTLGNESLQFQSTVHKEFCPFILYVVGMCEKEEEEKKIWSDFYHHHQLPLSGKKEQYSVFMFLEWTRVCDFKEFNSNDNCK